MALYRYEANLSETDRFNQVQIARDDGSALLMEMGLTYNLTTNEYRRAAQTVVMVSSSDPAAVARRVAYLPLIGVLNDGDVPVWSASLGAFVPGSGGEVVGWKTAVATLGDLPPDGNIEGDVHLVIADLTLYAWHVDAWVPLAGGGGSGGGVLSDYIDIAWSSTGLDVGESPIWNAALSRFEPGVL